MKKLSQEEFLQKAKEKHGNLYDYSKTVYVNSRNLITIICHLKDENGNEHGEFTQKANSHLSGQGCPKCGRAKVGKANSKSIDDFLKRAHEIHGNKYDYSKSVYKGSNNLITIICPKHGEFKQNACSHLLGIGCPKCFNEKRGYNFWKNRIKYRPIHFDSTTSALYKQTFLLTALKNYNKLVRQLKNKKLQEKNNKLKIIKKLEEKQQKLKIKEENKMNTQKFINLSKIKYVDKYDYSLTEYIDNKTPITLTCNICGTTFSCLPGNHLKNLGCCPVCALEARVKNLRGNTEWFIEKAKLIHGDKYNYDNVEYFNELTHVLITCKKHGHFLQVPKDHLNGCGCPKCKNKTLTLIFLKLKENFPEEEILYEVGKNVVPWLGLLRFDIYFPKYNIAIEYDGKQHYIPNLYFGGIVSFNKTLELDKLKELKCDNNNCKLFRIKYDYTETDLINLFININKIILSYEN